MTDPNTMFEKIKTISSSIDADKKECSGLRDTFNSDSKIIALRDRLKEIKLEEFAISSALSEREYQEVSVPIMKLEKNIFHLEIQRGATLQVLKACMNWFDNMPTGYDNNISIEDFMKAEDIKDGVKLVIDREERMDNLRNSQVESSMRVCREEDPRV